MTTLSADTDPRIEKIQIEMLRQATPARKMRMVAQMNQTVRTLMMAGLKQRNPEASPETLRRMTEALAGAMHPAQQACGHQSLMRHPLL